MIRRSVTRVCSCVTPTAGGSTALVFQRERLRAELAAAKSEWRTAQAQYEELVRKANASPDNVARGMFVYLAAQNAVLFEWVYFRFDWNLVEPITYLLGYSAVWLGVACFFLTGREFSYDRMRLMLIERKLNQVLRKSGFDRARHEMVKLKVQDLESRIKALENL